MIKELIVRVQPSDQSNCYDYDIYLSDDDYIDCNVTDGGIIEDQTFAEAVKIAGEHAKDYITQHYPDDAKQTND